MKPPAFLYGTAWKEGRTALLTELALRAGFRGIDTANQRKHYFEAAVGEGLAAAYRDDVVTRDELFLQTKFTYRRGQDDRLPYDPSASLTEQVAQSLASSLTHLGTVRVDSFLLHGPALGAGWTAPDEEVWAAMRHEREAGRAGAVGVSNVSLLHLTQLKRSGAPLPELVQNRCYARLGWDREVRKFCAEHGIVYQGFSLLTANPELLRNRLFTKIAARAGATPEQVVFAFARAVGILPLTGTTQRKHMLEDLESTRIELPQTDVRAIETLAG